MLRTERQTATISKDSKDDRGNPSERCVSKRPGRPKCSQLEKKTQARNAGLPQQAAEHISRRKPMSQLQHPCKKLRKGTENEQVPRPNKDQKPSRTELWGWERMESGKRWKRKREENRKSSPWCHRHHHMQELFFSIAQGNKSNIVSLIMRMRDAQKSPRRLN